MARNPFIEIGRGGFLPSGDVVNIAGRMTARETAIRYVVDDWRVIEATGGPIGQASRVYHPVPNRAPSTILRVTLRDPRLRLHAIRAESDALIEGGLGLTIQAAQEGAGSGSVSHRPDEEAGGEAGGGDAEGALSGRLLIAADRFRFILDRLRAPGARLSVSITLPVYKSALAHETDRDGMRQDLYLRHGETVPITGYALEVEHGPPAGARGEQQMPDAADTLEPNGRERPERTTMLLGLVAGLLVLTLLAELLG